MMGACHRDVQRKMMGWWGALCAKSKENWPGQILVWCWPGTGLVQAGAGLVQAGSRLAAGVRNLFLQMTAQNLTMLLTSDEKTKTTLPIAYNLSYNILQFGRN